MSTHDSPLIEDPVRLAALQETALLDSPPEEAFDRLTRMASKVLRIPIALVALVDGSRQFFKSQSGLPEPVATGRETPLSYCICKHVVASGDPLIIADARAFPLVQENLAITEMGVAAYAGIPLTTSDGHTLGSFCAIDVQPRDWTAEEIEILTSLAASAMTEIELRLTARQLRDSFAQLKQLEALRDDLTDMIVHDLRTPLSSLLIGLRSLELMGDLNDDQREFVDLSVSSGDVLLGMIGDLLDVSKMESGTVDLEYEEVTPESLVQAALLQIGWLSSAKSLEIVTNIAPDVPSLEVDKKKIVRVLVNLLGNAAKFAPDGGVVSIAVRGAADPAQITFSVSDNGPGIPPEAFGRIFEKFGQVKNDGASHPRSTGLGLTFCKMVVEAHGGRIWVESEVGQGSTFLFAIPRWQTPWA